MLAKYGNFYICILLFNEQNNIKEDIHMEKKNDMKRKNKNIGNLISALKDEARSLMRLYKRRDHK